jgi:hypothetical protein
MLSATKHLDPMREILNEARDDMRTSGVEGEL